MTGDAHWNPTPIVKTIEDENTDGTFDEKSPFDKLPKADREAIKIQLKSANTRAMGDPEAYRKNLLVIYEQLQREDSQNSKDAAVILTENIVSMTEVFKEAHQEVAA